MIFPYVLRINVLIYTVLLKCKLPLLVSFLARRVLFLLRRISFLSRRVSFLSRRVLFLSRITEAFSLEYITCKKPACISKTVLLHSHVSINTNCDRMYTVRYSVYRYIQCIARSYTKVCFQQRDIFKQVTNDKTVTETAKS